MNNWRREGRTAWTKNIGDKNVSIIKIGRKYHVTYKARGYITEHLVPFDSLDEAMDYCDYELPNRKTPFEEEEDYE